MTRWIDAHPYRSFLALTTLYVITVCAISSMKLLWLDELITLHIARLGSVRAIWNALAQGADPNPPLIHILVMACRSVFGEHELALRLPAIVGYWVGMLSLFLFLLRRLTATWALAGTVLSTAMAAFEYSYESRSYAVFYGFAMLAVYSWSRSRDQSRRIRRLALAGIVVGLAGGLCTNYFAVLAFFPVAAGEVIRTLQEARRGSKVRLVSRLVSAIDWPIWSCITISATPLLLFRPLIQKSISQFSPYAWNKVSFEQVTSSYTEMVEIVLYPIVALLLFTFAVRVMGRFSGQHRASLRPRWIGALADEQTAYPERRRLFGASEMVAVLMLALYPVLGYLVANIRGGMLSPRFVIPVCFGFAIIGIATVYRLFGHMRFASIVTLLFCLAWFIARTSYVGYTYNEQKESFYKVIDRIPLAEQETQPHDAKEPIVIGDPLMVLTFEHYAPASMASRAVFPVDFPAIRRSRGEDSPEENLWVGRNLIYHLPIVTLAELQQNTDQYLIVAWDGDWVVDDLRSHSYPVLRLGINTRAGAIGGFTPLSHRQPVLFWGMGDRFYDVPAHQIPQPIPFRPQDNLPTGKARF